MRPESLNQNKQHNRTSFANYGVRSQRDLSFIRIDILDWDDQKEWKTELYDCHHRIQDETNNNYLLYMICSITEVQKRLFFWEYDIRVRLRRVLKLAKV